MDNKVNNSIQNMQNSVQKQSTQQSGYELDLLRLIRELLRNWYWILLAALLFGGAAGAYFKYMVKPTYQATSVLYIYSKETTLTSLTDLQIGSWLTEDYKVIVKSRPVMQEVVKNLDLPISYKTLLGLVSLKNPEDTRVLKITATYTDPEMAKIIADEVASVSKEYISDIMDMAPPKFIETAEVPTVKSGPATTRNAMLAAILGAILVCGVLTVRMVLDDTIKTSDDVQKYLSVPVLSSIARSSAVNDEKQAKKAAKKAKKAAKKGGKA